MRGIHIGRVSYPSPVSPPLRGVDPPSPNRSRIYPTSTIEMTNSGKPELVGERGRTRVASIDFLDADSLICPSCYFVAPVAVYFYGKSPAQCAHPAPARGGVSTVTKRWARGAMGVWCHQAGDMARTAKSCGPDAPVLASSSQEASASRRRWWHSMATREITYKPSSHCAGKAGLLPLNLYAHVRISLCINAHETAGAARTRSSLRPLLRVASALSVLREQTKLYGSDKRCVARMRSHAPSSSRP